MKLMMVVAMLYRRSAVSFITLISYLFVCVALTGCGAVMKPQPLTTVFIGDSITQFWSLDQSFSGAPYTNKGIAGQVTGEILARFQSDAIAPAPNRIVILAGTNDVLRYQSVDQALTNLHSMVVAATAAHIAVVVCTLPPVDKDISMQQGQQYAGDFNPEIQHLNSLISSDPTTYSGCDYHKVLSDPATGLPLPGVLKDGVHPSPLGYRLMTAEVSRLLN